MQLTPRTFPATRTRLFAFMLAPLTPTTNCSAADCSALSSNWREIMKWEEGGHRHRRDGRSGAGRAVGVREARRDADGGGGRLG